MAWNACTAPFVGGGGIVVIVRRSSVSSSRVVHTARAGVCGTNVRFVSSVFARVELLAPKQILVFVSLYSFHNSVVSGVYSFHLRVVTARKLLLVSLGVVEISDLFGVGSHLWFLILASA